MIGNWYLLEKVLDWVILHPEKYDQTQWSCGTTRCIAGWIADMAGYQFISAQSVIPNYVTIKHDDDGYMTDDAWDYAEEVETVALNLLRIDHTRIDPDEIASMLFAGPLTWRDVLQGVWVLAQADDRFLPETIINEMRRVGVIEEVDA